MFRNKDKMLAEVRQAKKKNSNKEGKEQKVDFKDLHRFPLKGIQQELIKEGIRVHLNDLRQFRHITLSELTDEEKNESVGNTTLGTLLEKINKNEFDTLGFGYSNDIITKTHDMTRWKDNKKKTLNRKRDRFDKINNNNPLNE
jgi:hypothetical protein